MASLLNDLITYFGLPGQITNFSELISWILPFVFGICILRFVLYSIFSITNNFVKRS